MASKIWTINSQDSEVSFLVKKLGIFNVRGTIADFTGEVAFERSGPNQAHFNVCISQSTLQTDSSKRDEDLKSQKFFYVSAHPKICFQSVSAKLGNGQFIATEDLTIVGVKKKVNIPFTFSNRVFKGQLEIQRPDHRLGKKFPAFIVGNTIQVSIHCKIK